MNQAVSTDNKLASKYSSAVNFRISANSNTTINGTQPPSYFKNPAAEKKKQINKE